MTPCPGSGAALTFEHRAGLNGPAHTARCLVCDGEAPYVDYRIAPHTDTRPRYVRFRTGRRWHILRTPEAPDVVCGELPALGLRWHGIEEAVAALLDSQRICAHCTARQS